MTYDLSDDAVATFRKALELILGDVASWNQKSWGVAYGVTDTTDVRGDALVGVGEFTEVTGVEPGAATACRTAYCLAGHVAVTLLGYRPIWNRAVVLTEGGTREAYGTLLMSSAFAAPDGADTAGADTADVVVDGAGVYFVSSVAGRALGLDEASREVVFDSSNSLRRLVELAFLYTDGRVDLFADYALLLAADAGFALEERVTESAHARLYLDELANVRAALSPGDVPTRSDWELELEDV